MTLPAAAWRERVEFERRLVHASGTLYPVPFLLGWISWETTEWLLIGSVAIAGALEALRLSGSAGPLDPLYDALVRDYEADGIAGYALYQIGMAVAALCFAPVFAVPAMWMLSIGDPISGGLGENAATEPKRLPVVAAMVFVCFGIAVPYAIPEFGPDIGIIIALAGAVPAAIADGLPPLIRGVAVDDNLTIPPAAASGMFLAAALIA
ncbi:MAG: dolichol kinase [Methanobacteriota archaeon]